MMICPIEALPQFQNILDMQENVAGKYLAPFFENSHNGFLFGKLSSKV